MKVEFNIMPTTYCDIYIVSGEEHIELLTSKLYEVEILRQYYNNISGLDFDELFTVSHQPIKNDIELEAILFLITMPIRHISLGPCNTNDRSIRHRCSA